MSLLKRFEQQSLATKTAKCKKILTVKAPEKLIQTMMTKMMATFNKKQIKMEKMQKIKRLMRKKKITFDGDDC